MAGPTAQYGVGIPIFRLDRQGPLPHHGQRVAERVVIRPPWQRYPGSGRDRGVREGDRSVRRARAGVLADRSQFFKDLSAPFYGANRPGAKVSQGLRDSFWLQGMLAGHKAVYDCIKAFSETDFTEDLKKFDVPTLILSAARHVLHAQRSSERGTAWVLRTERGSGRVRES